MSSKTKSRLISWLVGILVVHFIIETTGHRYLYNTLAMTVFKGKLGPDIKEYHDMPNSVIEHAQPQPWPLSKAFGSKSLTDDAMAYHEQNQSVSYVVIHRDSLLFETYWEDFGIDSISNSFSMAKSVVSLLVGIAIDEGRIKSLDDELYRYMPQYRTELGEHLTIKNLLTMSSGINFDEHYLNPFAFPARANYGDNLELLLSKYEVTEMPGETFKYQSGNTQILGLLVKGVMRESLASLASQHVWKKIGAENDALWSLDSEGGLEKAFCCINATARDFARIGKLYADYGKWNGKQIVDSAYVAASIRPAGMVDSEGKACDYYGYQWWLGEHQGHEFFFMRGIKGQYVVVIPDEDLIMVRLGRKRDFGSRTKPHPDDVYNYLDMALAMIES